MTLQKLNTPESTPVTNQTISVQMNHRTIRAFTGQKLTEEEVRTLLEVARHTASAAFLQQCTVIHVVDPEVRAELHGCSGQPYVGGDKGELFVFVVDLYRNSRIRAEAGLGNEPLSRMNLFLEAVEDTTLAAQNMVVAAESMGLGTCYLGSINADPRRVIAALGLPKLTYPLFGLLVGHRAQEPQFKPRLPLEITSGVDSYPFVDSYAEALAEYDAVIQEYYELREGGGRLDSFTNQIRVKPGKGPAEASPMLEILHEQGLALL
ncbi:NADPH-dependent oxidoreductase [Buchananella felis]|uniref:NADPH-dependent oxidoreductase n=1 Tax=Buchananella felis TaxID=3231492 RepID=UPI0035280BC8